MGNIGLNEYYKISIMQKTFLISNVLQDEKQLINEIMKGSYIHNKWHININKDVADKIRDLCLEMLQLVGFDKNYELTEEGKILEELIDVFYVS